MICVCDIIIYKLKAAQTHRSFPFSQRTKYFCFCCCSVLNYTLISKKTIKCLPLDGLKLFAYDLPLSLRLSFLFYTLFKQNVVFINAKTQLFEASNDRREKKRLICSCCYRLSRSLSLFLARC